MRSFLWKSPFPHLGEGWGEGADLHTRRVTKTGKLRHNYLSLVSIFILLQCPVEAGERKTPTAPTDYLERKNQFYKDPEALERGRVLYGRKCKSCHGEKGDGKGLLSEGLDPMPRDFTDRETMGSLSDGQLFWITENGSPGTAMKAHGRGSDDNLPDEDIWKVIVYIRRFANPMP